MDRGREGQGSGESGRPSEPADEIVRPGLFDEVDFGATRPAWPSTDLGQAAAREPSPDEQAPGDREASEEPAEADAPAYSDAPSYPAAPAYADPPSDGDEPPSAEDPALRAFVESEEVPAAAERRDADVWPVDDQADEAIPPGVSLGDAGPAAEPVADEGWRLSEQDALDAERAARLEAAGAESFGEAAPLADEPAAEREADRSGPDHAAPGAVPWLAEAEPLPDERPVEGRLARLHLRGGMVSLARAELETMAGQGTLDRPALADLAEARWRSGDLLGAGEAAEAHIARGGSELMALVVAAEALSAQARTVEARRLAAQVVERAQGDLEPLFAGQPRALVWPRDGMEWAGPQAGAQGALTAGSTPSSAGTREAAPSLGDGGLTDERSATEETGRYAPPAERAAEVPAESVAEAAGEPASEVPADDEQPATADGEERAARPSAVAGELTQRALARELEAIEWSVEHGEFETLAGRLAIVLQTDRDQAQRVGELAELAVELLGGRGDVCAELHLVRGDAMQVMGRKADASDAYRASARALEPPPALGHETGPGSADWGSEEPPADAPPADAPRADEPAPDDHRPPSPQENP